MQGSKQVKTFGINEAYIAAYSNGVTASWEEIPLVQNGTLELTVQEEEVRDGEGFLDHIWYHSQDANVSLTTALWMMRVLELISGNAVSSYNTTSAEAIHFGTDGEITPPSVRLKLRVQAKDHSSDATAYAWLYIFKARAAIPPFNAAQTAANQMEMNFRALRVTDDDQGRTIAQAYGRIELGASS